MKIVVEPPRTSAPVVVANVAGVVPPPPIFVVPVYATLAICLLDAAPVNTIVPATLSIFVHEVF